MISGIFWRLYLSVIGVIILTISIVSISTSYYLEKDQLSFLLKDIKQTVELINHQYQATDNLDLAIDSAKIITHFNINLLNQKQRSNIAIKKTLISKTGEIDIYIDEHQEFIAIASVNNQLFISIADSQQPNDPEEEIIVSIELLGITLALLSVAAVLYYCIFGIVLHIQRLIKASQQFSNGDYSARADTGAPHPLNELAVSFNTMAITIQNSIFDQKVLSNAMAHELRTPLSKFRLALGLLETYELPAEANNLVNNLDDYTTELQGLTDELLMIATLESQKNSIHPSPIDLGQYVENRCNQFRELYKNRQLIYKPFVNTTINSEARYLQLVIDNVLKNACKFSHSLVVVEIVVQRAHVIIKISDDGPGIATQHYKMILRPFSRLDASREKGIGGYGLGLSIANTAIARLGGEIKVEASSLGGATFKLILPVTPC